MADFLLNSLDQRRGFATACALISVAISSHTIFKHLKNFTLPRIQVNICRILFMVPIYAVHSCLSIWFPNTSFVFDTLRDCYEAYVIYQFVSLIIAYLGGESHLIEVLELKPSLRQPWPFNYCFRRITLGQRFLYLVKQGTLQFVIVKPLMSVATIIFTFCGMYDEGSFSLKSAYIYIAIINNISVSISLYCLVLFYMATETQLKDFHPLAKFLCIKSVVFFSYWQYCTLQLLVQVDVLSPEIETAASIQDQIICVEMVIASLAHTLAFSHKEFADDSRMRNSLLYNLREVVNVQELVDDVVQDARHSYKKYRNKPIELEDLPSFGKTKVQNGLDSYEETDVLIDRRD